MVLVFSKFLFVHDEVCKASNGFNLQEGHNVVIICMGINVERL
jgi:hypothetical protein